MAILTIQRDQGYADMARKYRVLLDGEEIGRIAHDEVLRREISDGPHVLQAKIDWCGSRPLKINAQSGDSVVTIRSALRGWRILLGFYYVLINRFGYLRLELQNEAPAQSPPPNQ